MFVVRVNVSEIMVTQWAGRALHSLVLILPVGGVPAADSVVSCRHFHEKKKL
jgi:hypothetical protein